MKLAPILVLLVSLGIAGCGLTSHTPPPLLYAIDSGVEGVPIPRKTYVRLDPDRFDVGMWMTWDMSYDYLTYWYDQHMPVGQDFEQWAWCDGGRDPDDAVARTYSKGPRHFMIITLFESFGRLKEQAISIDRNNYGPC